MRKNAPRASAAGILLSLALIIVLSLAFSTPVYATDADGDTSTPIFPSFVIPTPTPLPVASAADLVVDDMPISFDSSPGYITVEIPLKYKLAPINYYNYQLQYLEVYPVFDNPSDSPFDIASSQLTRTLIDMSTRIIDGRPVTYLSFPFAVKSDTMNDTYNIKFHARFMHQGGSMLYDAPAETEFIVPVKIVHGLTPTPTPTPTPEPTTPAPQPVPKVIISAFQTDPEIIMIGDQFNLTLSLFNTSEKIEVSNIKCILDGGDIIVPVSGSNSFYIDRIGKQDSYNAQLSMSAQPVPASSTSTAVGKSQQPVKVTMEYEYRTPNSLESTKVEETFTIKIRQEVKVELNPARVDPSDVSDGDYFDVSMSLINKGKAAIYNLTAKFEGPSVFRPDDVFFGGLVSPGESKALSISCTVVGSGSGGMGFSSGYGSGGMIVRSMGGGAVAVSSVMVGGSSAGSTEGSIPIGETPTEDMMEGEIEASAPISGPQQCAVIVTYEDEYGVETRESVPVTVYYTAPDDGMSGMDMGMDMGMAYGDDMGAFNPDGMIMDEGAPAGPLGIAPWLFWGSVGIVSAGLLTTAALLLRKRAKRKSVSTDAME